MLRASAVGACHTTVSGLPGWKQLDTKNLVGILIAFKITVEMTQNKPLAGFQNTTLGAFHGLAVTLVLGT